MILNPVYCRTRAVRLRMSTLPKDQERLIYLRKTAFLIIMVREENVSRRYFLLFHNALFPCQKQITFFANTSSSDKSANTRRSGHG